MTVLLERDEPIAVVRLNRPEALNALSNRLMSELVGALENLDADEAVRCIVIAGDEKAFASGADTYPGHFIRRAAHGQIRANWGRRMAW